MDNRLHKVFENSDFLSDDDKLRANNVEEGMTLNGNFSLHNINVRLSDKLPNKNSLYKTNKLAETSTEKAVIFNSYEKYIKLSKPFRKDALSYNSYYKVCCFILHDIAKEMIHNSLVWTIPFFGKISIKSYVVPNAYTMFGDKPKRLGSVVKTRSYFVKDTNNLSIAKFTLNFYESIKDYAKEVFKKKQVEF